jgi:hypothetical protein
VAAEQAAAFADAKKRAEAGDAKAMLEHGFNHMLGFGTPIDLPTASEWIRRAAEKGNEDAYFPYGQVCQRGEMRPKDLKEALRCATHDLGLDVNYGRTEDKLQDRDLLVEFGKAMRRRNKDVFIRPLLTELRNSCSDNWTWVITDWRYLNEYDLVAMHCCSHGLTLLTVHIERHGWQAANEEERINLEEVVGRCPIDVSIQATSGDEESVLLAGIRTAKL